MKGQRLSSLSRSLIETEYKEQYDESIKRLLADRQIIAWILRGTTEEFRCMSIAEIIPYIENSQVSKVPVNPGLVNRSIEGLSTESKIIDENVVYYDVRFSVIVPNSSNTNNYRIIVDLEGQKDPTPGYSIPTRGIIYGSRMISEQLGRNVLKGDYDNLDKVYSIWLIFNCNRKISNTIVSYSVKPTFIHGYCDELSRYDVLSVININMPKDGDIEKSYNPPSELHRFLYDIFVVKNSASKKIKIIEERYDIITETTGGRIKEMCNLSEALIEETQIATQKSIITRLLSKGKTVEEIEDLTGYPLSLIEETRIELEENQDL